MKKRNIVQRGFTLAEVLITLVIIGVIGALTVPALIQNTQKQELVSALKKTYSTLSQAANMIIAEEGSPLGDDGWADTTEHMYEQLKKHLNISKDCGTSNECFPHSSKIKSLQNRTDYYWNAAANSYLYKLILSDGVMLIIGSGFNGEGRAICADINGEKKPNQYGRDIFWFVLNDNGLSPSSCDSNACPGGGNNGGAGCACKVLTEGKMDY